MKNELLIISTLLVALTACNENKDNKDNTIENTTADTAPIVTQTPDTKIVTIEASALEEKLIKRGQVIEKMNASKTLRINNQEFKLLSEVFQKGAKVFNTHLKEPGTVKGTIVVVTTEQSLPPTVTGQKIAANTFRLAPNSGQSLLSFYGELTKDNAYSTVELEIDYSPFTSAPAM